MNQFSLVLMWFVIVVFSVIALIVFLVRRKNAHTSKKKFFITLAVLWILAILFSVAVMLGLQDRSLTASEKLEISNYITEKSDNHKFQFIKGYASNHEHSSCSFLCSSRYYSWDWKNKVALFEDENQNELLYIKKWMNGKVNNIVIIYNNKIYEFFNRVSTVGEREIDCNTETYNNDCAQYSYENLMYVNRHKSILGF